MTDLGYVESLFRHKQEFLQLLESRYSFDDDSMEQYRRTLTTIILPEGDSDYQQLLNTEYNQKTKDILVNKLDEYGLSKKGNKDVLITRIIEQKTRAPT